MTHSFRNFVPISNSTNSFFTSEANNNPIAANLLQKIYSPVLLNNKNASKIIKIKKQFPCHSTLKSRLIN